MSDNSSKSCVFIEQLKLLPSQLRANSITTSRDNINTHEFDILIVIDYPENFDFWKGYSSNIVFLKITSLSNEIVELCDSLFKNAKKEYLKKEHLGISTIFFVHRNIILDVWKHTSFAKLWLIGRHLNVKCLTFIDECIISNF